LRELKKRNRLLEQENEVLSRATAYLSQANLPGKIVFPLVREMAAASAPIRVPVAVACRVLGTQGYYKWLKEPACPRDWDDAHTTSRSLLREHPRALGARSWCREDALP